MICSVARSDPSYIKENQYLEHNFITFIYIYIYLKNSLRINLKTVKWVYLVGGQPSPVLPGGPLLLLMYVCSLKHKLSEKTIHQLSTFTGLKSKHAYIMYVLLPLNNLMLKWDKLDIYTVHSVQHLLCSKPTGVCWWGVLLGVLLLGVLLLAVQLGVLLIPEIGTWLKQLFVLYILLQPWKANIHILSTSC